VFRDKTSLSANPALWSSIERALSESEYFLLLASPQAAGSSWVKREVDWWLTNRSTNKMLILLTDGEIVWDNTAGDFDWSKTKALPGNLLGQFKEVPLYIDLRWAKTDIDLSLRHTRFRSSILDLASPLHGKEKDVLDGEDVRKHRITKLITAVGVLAILGFGVAAGWGWYESTRQKNEAVRQRQNAEREKREAEKERSRAEEATEEARKAKEIEKHQRLLAEERKKEAERQRDIALSRELAARSISQLPIDPEKSMLSALEAMGVVRTGQAVHALRRALCVIYKRVVRDFYVTFTDDGKYLVTRDKTIKIWELETWRKVAELHGNSTYQVTSAAVSTNEKWIFTTNEEYTVLVWEAATGNVVTKLPRDENRLGRKKVSPDGKWLYTHNYNGSVGIWMTTGNVYAKWQAFSKTKEDCKTSAENWVGSGHTSPVFNVGCSNDGKLVVSAGEDKTAIVWDVKTKKIKIGLYGHTGRVVKASFSPDSKWVVTGSYDGTARVWEVSTGVNVAVLRGHKYIVGNVAFSPDGKWVVTSAEKLRLWETTWRPKIVIDQKPESMENAVFSPNGHFIATSSYKTTWVRNAATGVPVCKKLPGTIDGIGSAVFTPDARWIVTKRESKAFIWETTTGKQVARLHEHASTIRSAAFSPNGKWIITASDDNTARIWKVGTWECKKILQHQSSVNSVAFSPDCHWVVTSCAKTTQVWNALTGKQVTELQGSTPYVGSAAFSADGKRVVTVRGNDSTACIWGTATGKLLVKLKGHTRYVKSAAFSPDGKLMVTVSDDKTARVWDSATGDNIAELRASDSRIISAAFSPDGKFVVTATRSGEGSIARVHTGQVWDARKGVLFLELRGHENYLSGARFSPNGKLVITTAWDNTARIFSCEACAPVEELLALARARVHHEKKVR
jgi:WD40 repeat protein